MSLSLSKRNYYGYLFISPFIIGFLIFGLYPVYNTIYLSFTDTTLMTREASFIGLKNFQRLFADDFFMRAVRNTWLIWGINFIIQIGIALLLSVWFTSARLKIRAVGGWRAIFFLPNLLMPAAVAALSPGGYRGQRVDASPEEILQAAKHLANHYRKADKPLPDTLAALV